jgi:hypothetical protein
VSLVEGLLVVSLALLFVVVAAYYWMEPFQAGVQALVTEVEAWWTN